MKQTVKSCLSVVAALLFLPLTAAPVGAAPAEGFSVRAVIPDNQVDTRQTYFDLRVTPGQTQTVQMEIQNSSDDTILVHTRLSDAATGRGGLIVYNHQEERDESLVLSVSDCAQVVQQQVQLEPGEGGTVSIDIQMPDDVFDGTLLGGLVITAEKLDEEEDEVQEGMQLQNELVYVIGLKLTQTDEPVAPELHLKGITPGLTNYRTSVSLNIQNSEPVIIKDMSLYAAVYRDGSEEIYRELDLSGVEMAPCSNGNFIIDWQSTHLEPGDYRLYAKAEHEGRIWEWGETFTISSGDAADTNSGAVDLETERSRWVIPLLVFALLAAFLLVFLVGRRSKEKEKE